jgi:hypothetical protein
MNTHKKNYVLVDYENVHVKSLALLNEDHFQIIIFLGKANTKLDKALVIQIHQRRVNAQYIELETSGKNALDFYIAYYIGHFSAIDPTAFFHIISKDTGFDPLLQHLKSNKILASRSVSIETMPCFDQPTIIPSKPPVKIKIKSKSSAIEKMTQTAFFNEYLSGLIKRQPANPKTLKGLFNHMKTNIDREMTDEAFQKILQAYIHKKYITVIDKKVTYSLPKRE